MKFLNGIGAMFALAVVALATTLTSCEKEDFNINVEPINAQATINATVLYVDGTTTTNVTDQAAITYSDGPAFVGNPKIEEKTVTVTAKYNNLEASNTVKVPSLEAGQILTLTTTIVLQVPAEGEETVKIEVETTEEETVVDTREEPLTNPSDFWYHETVTYTHKEGSKIAEKNIITTDVEEIALIGGFINTLEQTYKETTKQTEVPVYSHSLTKVRAIYSISPVIYTFKRVTEKDGEEPKEEIIATVKTEAYTTLFECKDSDQNLPIPGHGHAPAGHGHGYDHGHGTGNAGGGIVIPD